jgi:hypothetical protein
MTKKIFPGNYVNHLSSYQGQPIVARPGLIYHHVIGYARIGSAAATSFDIIIPSPDKRPDDKPRPDIVGMVVPTGVWLYKLGLRVVDVRKELDRGAARSGIVATNTDLLRLASGANTTATITATTAGTGPITAASDTFAPGAVLHTQALAAPVLTTSPITLRAFVANAANNAAGTAISSAEPGGSYLVAEACYFKADDVPDQSAFGGFPAIIETV